MSPQPQLQPTLQTISLPTITPSRSIYLISNLLSPDECNKVIKSHTNLVPSNLNANTIRDREVFSDPNLSTLLWSRFSSLEIPSTVTDEDGENWTVQGLNETFRLCRYLPGGKFSPHTDGRRMESVNEQSFMALNIYLATVSPSAGGATRILSSSQEVITRIQPELGQALMFRDDVWHDGEELSDGVKYLLRTDVMYARDEAFDFERLCKDDGLDFEQSCKGMGDEKKGRKALRIAEGLEDAGKGVEAIRWYKKAFKLWPALGGS